jgi:hypothetical protein
VKTNAKPAGTEISMVSRQMSPNSELPIAMPSAFLSAADFVDAYTTTDKTIADLTAKFVSQAGEAKKAQDDVLPHLAFMQSLLSKKGSNHEFVIQARKKGNKIPWWRDYYEKYKDSLWESLRTMERRIAAYRRDPSTPTTKGGKGTKPKHLTQLEHKLLGTATCVREVIVDLRAGRTDEAIAKLEKNTPTQDRIAEHLERGVEPTHANPDGDAKFDSDEPESTSGPADQLKVELANEPDRDVASRMLTEYLQTVANQFANDRIKIKEVKATVEFVARDHRILPKDWLEKRDQKAEPTLCKCTGVAEFMQRRRVQEWSNGKWSKERVIFSGDESNYRVVTEESARKLAPEVFETPATPEPGSGSAPGQQREEPPAQQGGADSTTSPNHAIETRESELDLGAPSKLEQAEAWLRRYLCRGPMPIPDSYIKNGLCRYNYAPDQLPPPGIGKKTIDQAIINLGVQRLPSGPQGGIRWHLPEPEGATPQSKPPKPPEGL